MKICSAISSTPIWKYGHLSLLIRNGGQQKTGHSLPMKLSRTTILAADAVIDDYRKMFLLDNQPKNKTENSENDSVNPQEVLKKV